MLHVWENYTFKSLLTKKAHISLIKKFFLIKFFKQTPKTGNLENQGFISANLKLLTELCKFLSHKSINWLISLQCRTIESMISKKSTKLAIMIIESVLRFLECQKMSQKKFVIFSKMLFAHTIWLSMVFCRERCEFNLKCSIHVSIWLFDIVTFKNY